MEDIIKREAYHRAKALLLNSDEDYKIDKVAELLERVSSLTKERQEMVEALRQRVFSFGKLLSIDEREFLQSLLSKFEP